MSKQKSERLKLVADLALRNEHKAAEQLSQARRFLEQQSQQLQTLESYLADYMAKIKERMTGVRSVAELQQGQGFIQQIGEAIKQQQLVVDHSQVQFDQAKAIWIRLKDKASSLEEVRSAAKKSEDLARESKLDKQIQDEYQSRLSFNR